MHGKSVMVWAGVDKTLAPGHTRAPPWTKPKGLNAMAKHWPSRMVRCGAAAPNWEGHSPEFLDISRGGPCRVSLNALTHVLAARHFTGNPAVA